MARKIEQIRNIGIIAHIDAGKTTVTERMLYYSGAKHRVGMVDKGTTETDNDPEEQERGITIYAACVTFPWKDVIVNLLDTPGHVDFTAEVERCLRVLDGGVVVFSAREGVEAQSETVWRQADKYKVPRVAFINKMDREGADFERTLGEIKARLNARPVPIQIPVGQGPPHLKDSFRGIIDLVAMKYLVFERKAENRDFTVNEIPEDLQPAAELWREQMLEALYDFSNELMELSLAGQPVPEELLHKVLREATVSMKIQPLLCGSALDGIGVQPILDAVARYLPCPLDVPPVEGVNPEKKNADPKNNIEKRKPSKDEPLSALVFKILPAKTGDFYWVRVYSGVLKANMRAFNPGKDIKENVAQLWQIHATKKEEQLESVDAGDIVGLIGPRNSITGDTLCDAKHPILLETIKFPETVISMAIEPESATERKKLGEVLEMMKRQDPTFAAVENEETGQTIISGMGELHLEVIQHRLERDFKLKVKVHRPRVSYRETIQNKVEVTGQCNRQMAGQQLFARVKIRLEPVATGNEPATVVNMCQTVGVEPSLIEAALEELRGRAQGGGIINGFPLIKMKVTLLGVEVAELGSTDVAFRIAAADAFEKGIEQATPVLLEPIMKLAITTPENYLGDFVGDLQQRRAIIAKTDQRGETVHVEAHAPLAELFGYSSAMRSLSQGRGGASMEPMGYSPAPPAVVAQFTT